ncbi:chromosome segregation protein SMC [Solimonas terrae]|uniref:Chromosome partition protein Smc n=1 Tax=Solimonas terrae TaxID=1396819 RepID=A0A6M2BUW9_9GAMM|nr:chromosome segregation protein SMC [Solimonas terrae]NGY06160.1 chromosome segregation protein SMC [Solimonas terrae]
MRLSGIKLAGFKSFVDPTHLPLPSNLTGVVGPNGCGKSNVIDAVRWVLGETSMKNLRSADAEDVIFNGSKTRKPVGRASVELIFDNSDGQIAGPFAAYAEISVRRELMRDGNSQYYLNSRKCLKRDVTDLFLGTGLGGKNQYAIIEQGMVSRMIEAKPEELRQWLEEAAGISKYKDRRRETESRIKQTRENLARLNDLRSEIQQRLEVLTKQAANAEKYRDLKTQERQLRAEILALRMRQFEDQGRGHEGAISEFEQALEAARTRVHHSGEARVAAEIEQRAQAQKLGDEQSKVYEAEAVLARQEQSLQHARELQQLKVRELDQINRQLGELEARERRERQRLEEAAQQLAELEQQALSAEEHEAAAQSTLIESEDDAQAEQRRWDSFQQDAETPLTQTEAERVRVQQLERARFQGEERLKRLEAEFGALNIAPVQNSLNEADAELASLADELQQAEARLQAMDEELQQLRDQRAAAETALHETRQSLQLARGRMASLETLQQAALRQDDAELNQWLRQQALSEAPRLASALQVESGWEGAVEQVLEGLLQAPLFGDFESRLRQVPAGPKAGIALLSAQQGQGGSGLAAKVTGPQAVLDWLSGIRVADSAAEAETMAAQLAPGESVITADGLWRGRHWLRYAKRGEDGNSGVIARGQLLKQLRVQVEEQQQQVLDREQVLGELRARTHAMEQERRDLASKFDQLRHRQAQKLAFRQAQAVRLEQMQSRAHNLSQEIEGLREAREQQTQELDESRTRLLSLEQIAQELRDKRAEMQQSLQRKRDLVVRARMALQQSQQARGQLQVNLAGRRSAQTALEQSLKELAATRQTLSSRKGEEEEKAAELNEPLVNHAEHVEQARVQVGIAREQMRALREAAEAVETALQQAIAAARAAESDKDAAVEKLQQARLEFENLRAHRESLEEQIAETGFERAALFEGLDPAASLVDWEEKLASAMRRIERLGAINLAAIQELEEAQARETYLGEQHADLHGALETLEEAIRKIDAETKELFKQTFDKVDTVFRDRFPKLFGGGEAYLELTGDNMLETGVRVMARPPGKRNSTIHLLSGGEKAMTAAALLLALFQLNPAPFCLMDEVDAPLDDANVGRFCEVVREMSQNVQFIIITHNKITMELAQQLHGVTMQEPGVSRLVSVDIEQAVELTTQTDDQRSGTGT